MSQQSSSDLTKLVNSSGFLLQLAVESLVKTKQTNFRWVCNEYAWRDPISMTDRYVDLILESGVTTLLVECKRPRGAEWVFLCPNPKGNARYSVRCPRVRRLPQDPDQDEPSWLYENELSLSSVDSAYCVIRGQKEERLTLERICSELVLASEAVIKDEVKISRSNQLRLDRLYVPTIVTSATLFVCQFDPQSIDLKEGILPTDAAQQIPVPFVRFTKSFISAKSKSSRDLAELNRFRERTVLVINSEHLEDTLKSLSIKVLA